MSHSAHMLNPTTVSSLQRLAMGKPTSLAGPLPNSLDVMLTIIMPLCIAHEKKITIYSIYIINLINTKG